jgi:hypothetical protein
MIFAVFLTREEQASALIITSSNEPSAFLISRTFLSLSKSKVGNAASAAADEDDLSLSHTSATSMDPNIVLFDSLCE